MRSLRRLVLCLIVLCAPLSPALAQPVPTKTIDRAVDDGRREARPSNLSCMVTAEVFARTLLSQDQTVQEMAGRGFNLAMAQDYWTFYATGFTGALLDTPNALALALRDLSPDQQAAHRAESESQFAALEQETIVGLYRDLGACALDEAERNVFLGKHPNLLVLNWLVAQQLLPQQFGLFGPALQQRITVNALTTFVLPGMDNTPEDKTEMAAACRQSGGIPMSFAVKRTRCFDRSHPDYSGPDCQRERTEADLGEPQMITLELGCLR